LNNILKSILGGVCIGLGCFAYLITLQKTNNPVIASSMFYLGLSLILFNKYKLFTGEVYTKANLSLKKYIKTLTFTWIGNLVGSVIIVILLNQIITVDVTQLINHKLSLNPIQIIISGLFCNLLVCSSVKNYIETKNHIIGWFWITAFVILGLEHSIANMTYLTLGFFNRIPMNILSIISLLLFSTLGNIVGGRIIYKSND
jgi:nitrite transporter NirC